LDVTHPELAPNKIANRCKIRTSPNLSGTLFSNDVGEQFFEHVSSKIAELSQAIVAGASPPRDIAIIPHLCEHVGVFTNI
jgi:hypothetical protein